MQQVPQWQNSARGNVGCESPVARMPLPISARHSVANRTQRNVNSSWPDPEPLAVPTGSVGIGPRRSPTRGTTPIWAAVKSHDVTKSGQPWDINHCALGSLGSDCREYKTLRTLSTIVFYTGLAGAATGAVLLLATPSGPARHQSGAQLTPWVERVPLAFRRSLSRK